MLNSGAVLAQQQQIQKLLIQVYVTVSFQSELRSGSKVGQSSRDSQLSVTCVHTCQEPANAVLTQKTHCNTLINKRLRNGQWIENPCVGGSAPVAVKRHNGVRKVSVASGLAV